MIKTLKNISVPQVDIVGLQSVLQTSIFQLVSSASDSDSEGWNKNFIILLFSSHLFCQEVPEEHVSLLLEYMYCGAIYVQQGTDSLSLSPSLVIPLFNE